MKGGVRMSDKSNELATLRSKASYSSMVESDQVKATYKGLNIVEDKRGFVSESEIDRYFELRMSL